MDWKTPDITELIAAALEEDLGGQHAGRGDLTALAVSPADANCRAVIRAKSYATVAGLPLVERVFLAVNAGLQREILVREGAEVGPGEVVFRVSGNARAILSAERTALNFLARLSGIATLTRQFVNAVAGTRARIRDTRKTTPLHRTLEKYAVRAGGGINHRFGLYDAILIKANHVAVAGSVGEAIARAQALVASRAQTARESARPESAGVGPVAPATIQVEVRDEVELREALAAGVLSVLLDNQSPVDAARLVQIVRDKLPACVVEISGGVNLSNVRAYAESGADFIAIGALTHSAPAADFSLLVEP